MKEYGSKKHYDEKLQEASDLFEAQKAAIQGISNTAGFQSILEYLDNVTLAAEERADSAETQGGFKEVRGHLQFCKNFKQFLTRLADTKK